MKNIKLLFIFFISYAAILAQGGIKNYLPVNVQYDSISTNIIKLSYPNGDIIFKEIGVKVVCQEEILVTTFDLSIIDTSLFSNKYNYFKRLPISQGPFQTILINDVNENKKWDIYGLPKVQNIMAFPVIILEADQWLNNNLIYSFNDTTNGVLGIYDIDKDHNLDLFIRTWNNNLLVYGYDTNHLPTDLKFIYNTYNFTQIEDPKFGDFDKNNKNDMVFYLNPNTLKMVIVEYDSTLNNFNEIFNFFYDDYYAAGFAVGDFDSDSLTEFVMGSIHGDVYVVENKGVHTYEHTWTGAVQTYNAYLFFETNDIDKNGKKEFWVGGDAFYNGVPKTVFTCFENTGDDEYTAVHEIDFIGVFSFNAGNCFAKDFDGDGTEEIFICIDQNVIILKFTGKENLHDYKIYYLKQNEKPNGAFFGATSYDIDRDHKDEIFISQQDVVNNQLRIFTDVYKETEPVIVKEDNTVCNFNSSIYPNPFNPTTTIEYELQQPENVKINIYDITGRLIKELINTEKNAGKFSIIWDGKDNSGKRLASGVYYYRIINGSFVQTKKMILLK